MLKHYFAKEPAARLLFEGTHSLKDFKKKLTALGNTLPEENPKRWNRSSDPINNRNVIVGAGFELFCELLVHRMGNHPHIGLSEYVPTDPSEDYGIDAFAVNVAGEKSAIQCKFVGDPGFQFTTGDTSHGNIQNFIQQTVFKGIACMEPGPYRAFLITTCKGVHWNLARNMWNDRVMVFNGKFISYLVDNNVNFWKDCVRTFDGQL